MNGDLCESFDLLISASLDGETTDSERRSLDQHLEECEHCRERFSKFSRLNMIVSDFGGELRLDIGDRNVLQSGESKKPVVDTQKNWKLNLMMLGSLVSAAVIAFVMIDLGAFSSRPVKEVDLLSPIVKLTEINYRRLHDQEMMRESLEYDLRTLKMQVAISKDDSTAESESEILNRIDELLLKIEKTKYSNNETFQEL